MFQSFLLFYQLYVLLLALRRSFAHLYALPCTVKVFEMVWPCCAGRVLGDLQEASEEAGDIHGWWN